MARLLCFLALIMITVQLTKACSCMYDHPQTHACRADFVILARILSRKPMKDPAIPNAHHIGYKLKITQIFKSTEKADETLLRTKFVTTPREDSACGANLEIKQLYLITGSVFDGRAHISLCSFVRPWNQLSLVQRKGFRKTYYENCDCKIKICYDSNDRSCTAANKHGCGWSTDFNEDKDCEQKHAMCARHHNGLCAWEQNRYLTHCITKTRGETLPKHYNEAFDRIDP